MGSPKRTLKKAPKEQEGKPQVVLDAAETQGKKVVLKIDCYLQEGGVESGDRLPG